MEELPPRLPLRRPPPRRGQLSPGGRVPPEVLKPRYDVLPIPKKKPPTWENIKELLETSEHADEVIEMREMFNDLMAWLNYKRELEEEGFKAVTIFTDRGAKKARKVIQIVEATDLTAQDILIRESLHHKREYLKKVERLKNDWEASAWNNVMLIGPLIINYYVNKYTKEYWDTLEWIGKEVEDLRHLQKEAGIITKEPDREVKLFESLPKITRGPIMTAPPPDPEDLPLVPNIHKKRCPTSK